MVACAVFQVLADRLSECGRSSSDGDRDLQGVNRRSLHGQVCRFRQAARRRGGQASHVLHDRRQGRQDSRETGEVCRSGSESRH